MTFMLLALVLAGLPSRALSAETGAAQQACGAMPLERNYSYPPGAYLGDRMRELHARTRRQLDLPPAALRDIERLDLERLAVVDDVKRAIVDAFARVEANERAALTKEFDAALKDIAKIRHVAEYGFAYPKGDGTIAVLVFGLEQLEEWRAGMLAWGVFYGARQSVWPGAFLHHPPTRSSPGAHRIEKGDWEGAWEVEQGQIYVPGVRFFREVGVQTVPRDQR
jgi:hypothetical protein